MATRVGRPKTKITKQELYGAFARMGTRDRELALEVMSALHGALSPESLHNGSGEPNIPANSNKGGGYFPDLANLTGA